MTIIKVICQQCRIEFDHVQVHLKTNRKMFCDRCLSKRHGRSKYYYRKDGKPSKSEKTLLNILPKPVKKTTFQEGCMIWDQNYECGGVI